MHVRPSSRTGVHPHMPILRPHAARSWWTRDYGTSSHTLNFILPGGWPIRPILGFMGAKPRNWRFPAQDAPETPATTVQNLTPLALFSPEKSVGPNRTKWQNYNKKGKQVRQWGLTWIISTHADLRPHAAPYFTNGASLAWRLRCAFLPWTLLYGGCPIRPILGFWGAKFPKMGHSPPRTSMNHRG